MDSFAVCQERIYIVKARSSAEALDEVMECVKLSYVRPNSTSWYIIDKNGEKVRIEEES